MSRSSSAGLAALCGALLSLGASSFAQLPIEPSLDQIARQAFDCEPEGTVGDLSVDLVIDDSKSMAGFLRVPGGDYRRVLQILTRSGRVSRLTIRTLNRPDQYLSSSDQLFDEHFYGHFDDTPIQNAFKKVKLTPPNVVTVLVSDLEQSQKNTDARTVVQALSPVLDAAPDIMIMGLSAAYYENSQRCSPNCSDTSRHFYVMALAHKRKYLGHFVSMTGLTSLADQRTAKEIENGSGTGPTVFYSRAPSLKALDIEAVGGQNDWVQVDGETAPPIDCDCGLNHAPFAAFATTAQRNQPMPPLLLRVNARIETTIDDSVRPEPEMKRVKVPLKKLLSEDVSQQKLTAPRFGPFRGNGKTKWIELQMNGDAPRNTNQWWIYRVRLKMNRGTVHVPWWIEQWSARDVPKDGVLVLENIVRAIMEETPADKRLLMEFWVGFTYETAI